MATLNIDPGKVRIDDYGKPPNYLVPTLRHVKNGEEHVALLNLLAAGEKGPQLLAASYAATVEPSADPELVLVQQQESAFLYRHEKTAPRIYGATGIVLATNDDEALSMVLSDSFDRLERAVVTLPSYEELATESLGPDQLPLLSSQESGRASFSGGYVDYGNDLITARIATDRPVMVVFSELYYPGWSATVDGEPAEIWKTNYTLRGVTVPEGEHLVEMRFSPPIFRLSMAISLATVGLILVVSVLLVFRPMNRPSVQD